MAGPGVGVFGPLAIKASTAAVNCVSVALEAFCARSKKEAVAVEIIFVRDDVSGGVDWMFIIMGMFRCIEIECGIEIGALLTQGGCTTLINGNIFMRLKKCNSMWQFVFRW